MSAIWSMPLSREQLLDLRELSTELSQEQMPRVNAVTVAEQEPIKVVLQTQAADQSVLVSGDISGKLFVACQRCLEPVVLTVNSTMRVALIAEDNTVQAPIGYESVLMPADGIRLQELIEDELLLSVPLSARHPAGQCGTLAERLKKLGATSVGGGTQPFSELAQMLRKKQN